MNMAKASKHVASATVHTLNNDMATVARDFATFGKWTFNSEARAAILRRCADKETFNKMRIASLAAWLESDKGYSAADALANVDGTLLNPAAFGKGAKRTADQQTDYKAANNAWNYYLLCSNIESLTRAKAKTPRKARTPLGANIPDAPKAPLADNSAKAPPAALSAVVPVRGGIAETAEQFANCASLMSRIVKENAKKLTGDKGASLRALAEYTAKEIARINALKD
jgi:hypothetical protein